MGDAKPFRTVEQQIAILKSRGVSFQDEGYAASFLLRENYYAVVNGYKDALIDKQETNLAKEDRYVRGTDCRHFELMYEFDKRLRDNTMALLLDCENLMKNAVVYSFCSIHQGQDDCLDPSCYCSKADFPKRGSYTKGLIRLLSTLQRLRDSGPHKAYISHYVSRYGCPPPLGSLEVFDVWEHLGVLRLSAAVGEEPHVRHVVAGVGEGRGEAKRPCVCVSHVAGVSKHLCAR